MLQPTLRTTPDAWAIDNRVYPTSAGKPGPRDPFLTPYMVPFGRAIAERTHRRVVLACSAQMGKSDTFLDVIGQRLDQAPAPILYVGPSKQFVTEQFEPRIMGLLDQAPSLSRKVARGKRMKQTRKLVAGVPLRLAHAGSPTALKSDPFALALTDEADDLVANVKKQGDPIGLVDRRGDSYADFVHAIVSTPSVGAKEVARDPDSGLEFWAVQEPEDIDSKIWALWQEGTRYHWAWPCPHCGEFFIPRFDCLEIPRNADPARAQRETRMICPRNGCVIDDDPNGHNLKAEMNARGVYVSPGQSIDPEGNVIGAPVDSTTVSFWVSGLCSPFRTFGDRAKDYVTALRSGNHNEIQAAMNGGFGEVWAPQGGDVPEWEEIKKLALPYLRGDVPDPVVFLTCGVDVQKNRLVYVVRGWGARQESWLIDAGEVWGDTALEDVWTDLTELMSSDYAGTHIARTFVDAGFRPGKKDEVPEHRVYEFCRRHARQAFATKGFEHRDKPLSVNRIDVTARGKSTKYGLDLVRLDSDFMKSWVHQRLRWPVDQPGGWHVFALPTDEHPDGLTDDYCRQIVSEARVRKPSGGYQWVVKARNNHFLDAEALAFAAAYMLGLQRLPDSARRPGARAPAPAPEPKASDADQPKAPPPPKRSGWLDGGSRGRGRGFLG
ncbi:MAG: phage terminase large subunit family protein [Candidatus Kaistia colombiensis]|nr:MAG: phage terminase large subunit family protein [Kaistia sp.]